jgi:H(+)-transporting ATP synthase subunit D
MIGETRPAATRSGLVRYARRLDQVRRGAELLKRKRQSLVEELFARARVAFSSREAIDAQSRRAWQSLSAALSSQGSDRLTPIGWPTREIEVDAAVVELWGMQVVELVNRPSVTRSLAARGMLPAAGESVVHETARQFETLIEQLLDAAPKEHVMRRIGEALSRTTRLVNTLEQRVAVQLVADLSRIRRTLNEREREEQLRTKRLVARRRAAVPSTRQIAE